MSESFRDEFCLALAEVHSVCARHVEAGGLPRDKKKTAVECTLNLLVDMITRLPEDKRDPTMILICLHLPTFVEEAIKEKGLSP